MLQELAQHHVIAAAHLYSPTLLHLQLHAPPYHTRRRIRHAHRDVVHRLVDRNQIGGEEPELIDDEHRLI